jgi:hypothetical protein
MRLVKIGRKESWGSYIDFNEREINVEYLAEEINSSEIKVLQDICDSHKGFIKIVFSNIEEEGESVNKSSIYSSYPSQTYVGVSAGARLSISVRGNKGIKVLKAIEVIARF